jgi:hypothetical protein
VRERLRSVEESLRRFVDRDMLALLQLSPEWHKQPLTVGAVSLAGNQVRIELRHPDYATPPLRLAIAEEDGLLAACVEEPGWLDRLAPTERRTLDQAIAGLYKLAGVDLVVEPGEVPPEPKPAAEHITERLCDPAALPLRNGTVEGNGRCVVFGTVALTWAQWVDWWRRDRAGEPLPPPFPVLPPPRPEGPALR